MIRYRYLLVPWTMADPTRDVLTFFCRYYEQISLIYDFVDREYLIKVHFTQNIAYVHAYIYLLANRNLINNRTKNSNNHQILLYSLY